MVCSSVAVSGRPDWTIHSLLRGRCVLCRSPCPFIHYGIIVFIQLIYSIVLMKSFSKMSLEWVDLQKAMKVSLCHYIQSVLAWASKTLLQLFILHITAYNNIFIWNNLIIIWVLCDKCKIMSINVMLWEMLCLLFCCVIGTWHSVCVIIV